ncbi:MAG: GDP-mannose 4,6-dehydratase, partial [ANME-2 cluster archaeon]|nr:GDP-mannose 4,6-dehydratase [ANME-2 cluster archaeon]
TSEVYGDPLVNPQPETYWGNVNPIGPRGVYDEAKRYAEAITMAYHRSHGIDTRIVRIFNTYGPRMRADDGRVVPNFINQALKRVRILRCTGMGASGGIGGRVGEDCGVFQVHAINKVTLLACGEIQRTSLCLLIPEHLLP